MCANELSRVIEEGVVELEMEWPPADSIFELRILRTVQYTEDAEARQARGIQEYLDFLHSYAFPLIDQLESDASIEYWHILNHGEYLDLRLLISSEDQMAKVQMVLAQHGVVKRPLTKWGVYDDPDLGSRLGCQALLRLYGAQSEFVRDLVRSIYWLRERAGQEAEKLISDVTFEIPIYTSHMLLNIFPANLVYEAGAHVMEGESRFRYLLDNGWLPPEAGAPLDKIREASQELRKLLNS